MLFNSYVFILFFLPLTLLLYFGANRLGKTKLAQIFLIMLSLYFYSYFHLNYLLIIIASVIFNYVCSILKTNKDIKLNVETLTRLLNRNPKPFTVSVEDSYLYRLFDYKKLVELINDNEIFKKSNISVDDIYQILINAYQIDNEEVFSCLIKTEQFKENNMKVIELLNQCNAKTFVKISDIIVKYIDKDFDILTLVKKRTDKNFIERLIIFILLSHFTENDYLLIHQLLNDKEISLNYNLYYADYFGQSTLKDLLAFSNDRNVLRDLLSKQENIKNCYFNGDWKIQLYTLYAKLGDYEKAIETFAKNYNYSYDFNEDYKDGFKNGQAEGDFEYIDSLVEFVKNICSSFEKDKIDYARQKDIIERILNSQNVRYINIERVLPIIKDYLSAEDFHELLSSLLQRYSVDDIGFITVIENDCFYGRYTIRIATEEEIQNSLAKLKSKNLKLVKKLIPQKNTGNK